MSSYQAPLRVGSFQHTLRGFLQADGVTFRQVLTEEQIQQIMSRFQMKKSSRLFPQPYRLAIEK